MSFLSQTMAAWNQVLALLAASFFLSVGVLLLGNRLYWRLGASRAAGTVIGVRETRGNMYYAVYRYTLPNGNAAEANADIGMSACAALKTGRPVRLLVFPSHPDKVMDAGGWYVELFGVLLAGAGGFMIHFALTAWPVTDMTWVVLAVFLGLGLRAIIGKLRRRPDGAPPSSRFRRTSDELRDTPVRPIEDLLANSDKAALPGRQQKSKPFTRPILVVIGLVLAGLAVYTGEQMARLTSGGVRAAGTVERVDLDRSSSHGAYFPAVRFTDAAGGEVRFTDRAGSNPPRYRPGDPVTVLYLPQSPSASAVIDHGVRNWLMPIGLAIAAVLVFVAAWRTRPPPKP